MIIMVFKEYEKIEGLQLLSLLPNVLIYPFSVRKVEACCLFSKLFHDQAIMIRYVHDWEFEFIYVLTSYQSLDLYCVK